MGRVRLAGAALAALIAACGGGGEAGDPGDGPDPADAGVVRSIDAGASIDAAPPAEWPMQIEMVSSGGRLRGGDLTMDVQVGHTMSQRPIMGGSFTLEGAAVVKPMEVER